MDRNTLLAIILCFGIFLGWQKFYIEPRMPKAPAAQSTTRPEGAQTQAPSATSPTLSPSAPPQATTAQNIPAKTLPLEVATGTAIVGNGNQLLSGWDLKRYKASISPEAAAIGLNDVVHEKGAIDLAFDRPELAYLSNVRGELTRTADGANWVYEDSNVRLVRETRAGTEGAALDVIFRAEFKTEAPKFAFLSLASQSPAEDAEEQDRQLVYWTNEDLEREHLNDLGALRQITTPVKWIGATSRYFVTAIVSQGADAPAGLIQPTAERAGRLSMAWPIQGNSITLPVKAFFGPKELDLLRSVEPTLDHAVDFGMFAAFAFPLLKIMKAFFGYFHNWGVAIILLTLLVKIATYPLTYKGMKSMKEMAKIQPQLQALRDKYKDDREALNREMLVLMRSHGYNPMAGCFPILIQMPIFFALYQVLYSSVGLYQAPFLLWIQDLSAKDPFYVTPVLLSGAMYLQQKLTPTTVTDPAQAKMMQLMPLIFGVFMLTLPSGLTLYMLVNALASIVQQLILNKKLNVDTSAPAPAGAR